MIFLQTYLEREKMLLPFSILAMFSVLLKTKFIFESFFHALVCLFICLYVKDFTIGHNFHISHVYSWLLDLFFSSKVQVICPGQGQIPSSEFSEKVYFRNISISQIHFVFVANACKKVKSTFFMSQH